MERTINDLSTPAILIERDVMEGNLQRMQTICSESGVQLWPHVKTHKLVPVLRRQLELGAVGATCAKIGEAEALLPSGVRRIFIAHSLVDVREAPRLARLQDHLDELILAVTSPVQCGALELVLAAQDLKATVLMAVDTGLNREGARGPEAARELAETIRSLSRMNLIGIYTHEGHSYLETSPSDIATRVDDVHAKLVEYAKAVGGSLSLWPGCSVTAAIMAKRDGVHAVRPGAYVFNDLYLTECTGLNPSNKAAVHVLATVIDLPEPGLALIDAGSKIFSSDKTPDGVSGRCVEDPSVTVTRLSEEHGFLSGPGVDHLTVGQRLRFIPAHVCPVINLASLVHLVAADEVIDVWDVDARGRSI